jgi:phenylpropionate dioxygenase-like ring-hydroxylating dioxygenase large terminal subunit
VDSAAPFVRNAWYVAFWSADLGAGALLARTILEEPIVFLRDAAGQVVALEDMCPHRFAPLSRGHLIDGDILECGYHGLRFDRTGSCVYNPHGDHKIPPSAKVRSYPVVERYSLAWIWMGEGEGDVNGIPDYRLLDDADPLHISVRDYMTIDAGYEIITNNLLDLSHVPFLHGGVLSGSVGDAVSVSQTGDHVMISRWAHDVAVPSLFDTLFRADGKNVDCWTEMYWMPVGCMILDTGVREPGSEKASGTGYFGLHLLTPENRHSTHYHFAAVRFNVQPRSREEDLALRETISVARRFAFAEQDKPMIEAQQRRMDAQPGRRPALFSVDAGATRVQRVLDKLQSHDVPP